MLHLINLLLSLNELLSPVIVGGYYNGFDMFALVNSIIKLFLNHVAGLQEKKLNYLGLDLA